MSNKKITFSLTFCITFTFAILYIFSILYVVIFSYNRNSKEILDMSETLISRSSKRILTSIKEYLSPAVLHSRHLSSFVENEILSSEEIFNYNLEKLQPIEKYFIQVLRQYSQIQLIYFGREDGIFYSATKMADNEIRLLINFPEGMNKTSWYKFVDSEDNILRTEQNPARYSSYDPRMRSWYQGASKKDGFNFTDMYVFASNKNMLGMTASMPFRESNGELAGVAACDIGLSDISTYLDNIKVGEQGKIVIVNQYNQLVAYPGNISEIMVHSKEGIRTCFVNETKSEWLKKAVAYYDSTQKDNFFIETQEKNYIVSVKPFLQQFQKDWKIFISIPEKEVIGELKRKNNFVFVVSGLILCISIILIYVISRNISNPIIALAEDADNLRKLTVIETPMVNTRIIEIEQLYQSINLLKHGIFSFNHYVPEELVKNMILEGKIAEVGGEKKNLSIFFSSVMNFEKIVQSLPSEYLILHLAEYLDCLSEIILEEQGTIDKYVGDNIMAFWNAPLPLKDHAVYACRTALKIQEKLREMEIKWKMENKAIFPTFIGIHTGQAIVGNMGSDERINYTLLGDSVNLASRIKDANNLYKTKILVSEDTMNLSLNEFKFRPVDQVQLKGRQKTVVLYELTGDKSKISNEIEQKKNEMFDVAFEFYLNGKYSRSIEVIEEMEEPEEYQLIIRDKCRTLLNSEKEKDFILSSRVEADQ